MPPPDARADGHRYLYHWQPFTPDKAHLLERALATNTIYCPSPYKFNDPWDCKPHFNTRLLLDPKENDLHFEWARDIAKTEERELRARFGREVASIVVEVTDDKTLPKAERKRLQIEHAHSLSPHAKLVKLADKIANVRDVLYRPPTDWSAERREEYVEWARQVVE